METYNASGTDPDSPTTAPVVGGPLQDLAAIKRAADELIQLACKDGKVTILLDSPEHRPYQLALTGIDTNQGGGLSALRAGLEKAVADLKAGQVALGVKGTLDGQPVSDVRVLRA